MHPPADALLDAHPPADVRDHLAGCPRCRVFVRLHAGSHDAPPGLEHARQAMADRRSRSLSEGLRRAAARPLEVGARIGDWRVGERLGAGGAATVYRGTHVHSGQPAALKVVEAEGAQGRRTEREARAHQALAHANVVSLLGRLDHEPPVLVLELVPGPDLAEVLATVDLAMNERMALAADVVAGLAAVHAAGLVHRDLKPSNVLVDPTGGRLTARLTDLGLTKDTEASSRLTRTGAMLGTPCYMSPEQIADPRAVTAASDVFALCALLVEALTGQRVFAEGSLLEVFDAIRAPTRPVVPDCVPEPLRSRLQAGLALAPDARPDLATLADALGRPLTAWSPDTVQQVQACVADRAVHPERPMAESFRASEVHGRLRTRVRFALDTHGHVALQGPPGCGAWELAQAVANDLQASLAGGVHYEVPDPLPEGRWLLVGQALPPGSPGLSLDLPAAPAPHQAPLQVPPLTDPEARRFLAQHLDGPTPEALVTAAEGRPTALRIGVALIRRGRALPEGPPLRPWCAAAFEALDPAARTVWAALGEGRATLEALARATALDPFDVEDALEELVAFGLAAAESPTRATWRGLASPP